ncbi:hypothetical protein GCM10023188_40230 [Pontibacter saemangeumensis]|uniref:Uncharacterized protein n=2 Tax=Pontibacter saemangeumensis TaxID=1084525 RepID=A0ABP8LZZ6_9BACT
MVLLFTGCSKDDSLVPDPLSTDAVISNLTGDEILDVVIDPADFTADVDNPYFPLRPGETLHYVNTTKDRNETETIYITSTTLCETKLIAALGITARVVHVVETDEEGQVLEETYDWYAQDMEGNVWYMGEATTAFEDGIPSTEGSWEAGVDGAKPGIIMWADPWEHIGEVYYQEYYEGEAEDQGKVLPSKRTVKVPYGMYHQTLTTEDFTALEPDAVERKSYAEGIGMLLAESVKGGPEKEQEVLVAITQDGCTN